MSLKMIECLSSMIGNTPLLEIRFRYKNQERTVYAKAEHMNFSGSIKDRMAFHVLKKAMLGGKLKENSLIAEATSGNTGISFSAIGKALGHRVMIFMPDWMSEERKALIKSFGADIRLVSKEEGGFLGSIKMTQELAAKDETVFLPCQFANEDNVEAHYATTGPEIWWQLHFNGLTPEAFVAGVGTGGTVMGIGKFLKEKNPDIKVHPLEPANSPTLSTGCKVGKHRIQGISDEFIPAIVKLKDLDKVVSVDDGDSIIMAQKLAAQLGLGVGISSGANLIGAIKVQDEMGGKAVVATVFSDDNKKYLSTALLKDEPVKPGFIAPEVELLAVRAIRRVCITCCNPKECSESRPFSYKACMTKPMGCRKGFARNFDKNVDRLKTDSRKWSIYTPDVLPMWIADMDFCVPDEILKALQERVDHGIFGYCDGPVELKEIICQRLWNLYQWRVLPAQIQFMPGVVTCFNVACRAIGKEGDEVVVQLPTYPPMHLAPENSGRFKKFLPFVERNGRLEIDFEKFEASITPRTKLLLLCSPHNPSGRVYTREELKRLTDICLRHNIRIASDEIHSDLVLDGRRHIPTASLSPEVSDITMTFFAPSKTFNIPGLGCSICVIQNPALQKQFERAGAGVVAEVNVLGYTAAIAAYRHGQPWLDDLLKYLASNRDYALEYIEKNMPQIKCLKPDGTFLAWLDCRGLKLKAPETPYWFFLKNAKVALDAGEKFGPGFEQFARLNFACPRIVLEDALGRMQVAISQL